MSNPVREFLQMYDQVSDKLDESQKQQVIANVYSFWHDCRDCGDMLEDFNVYESAEEILEGIPAEAYDFLRDYGVDTLNPEIEIRGLRHIADMLDRVEWVVCWLDHQVPDFDSVNLDDYSITMSGETEDETDQTFTFHVVNDVVTEVM
jgi:hypothetical protein